MLDVERHQTEYEREQAELEHVIAMSLAAEAERLRFASEDWSDLLGSDICISFTETPRNTHSRGGRHVEFGAALALGKRCIIVGPRENVFHCLLEVERADSWPAVLTDLQRTIEREERG